MILEFLCQNFRSIYSPVSLCSFASKDKSMRENLYEANGLFFNKVLAITGHNASGKTNIFKALSMMQTIVINSYNHQPGDLMNFQPHKLHQNEPTFFSIELLIKEIRYQYSFSYNRDGIVNEYLSYSPNGKRVKIFERNNQNVFWGEKFRKDVHDSCQGAIKSNRLVLSVAANCTNIVEICDLFLFFKNDLVMRINPERDNWFNYSVHKIVESESYKKLLLEFLKCISPEIQDIRAYIDKRIFSRDDLPSDIPSNFLDMFVGKELESFNAYITYRDFEINVNEESDAIKSLFTIMMPIFDILETGKVMFFDELESHMHPVIVEQIVLLFLRWNEKTYPQMIYTTHSSAIFNQKLLRRDQLYLTDIERTSRETKLRSLSEIKNVRNDENVYKSYLEGKYSNYVSFDHFWKKTS